MRKTPWWTEVSSADLAVLRGRLVSMLRAEFGATLAGEIEDIAQQALVVLFRRRSEVLSEKDGLFRYLSTVARNEAIDRLRRARIRTGPRPGRSSPRREEEGQPTLDDAVDAETSRMVLEEFCALSELERLTLWGCVVEEQSIRSVARALGCNWHTVAAIVDRALRRIRHSLARPCGEGEQPRDQQP
jgi:RNA polymerase sigma-70 factor (ECF subfamily)